MVYGMGHPPCVHAEELRPGIARRWKRFDDAQRETRRKVSMAVNQ